MKCPISVLCTLVVILLVICQTEEWEVWNNIKTTVNGVRFAWNAKKQAEKRCDQAKECISKWKWPIWFAVGTFIFWVTGLFGFVWSLIRSLKSTPPPSTVTNLTSTLEPSTLPPSTLPSLGHIIIAILIILAIGLFICNFSSKTISRRSRGRGRRSHKKKRRGRERKRSRSSSSSSSRGHSGGRKLTPKRKSPRGSKKR